MSELLHPILAPTHRLHSVLVHLAMEVEPLQVMEVEFHQVRAVFLNLFVEIVCL